MMRWGFSLPLVVSLVLLVRLGAPTRVAAQTDDEPQGPDRQGEFIDTRLTFTFGDDDVFTPRRERVPVSALPGFGDRPQYELFFDNLNTRFTGRENLTHLVLHREMPAFADDVTTEAALVLRFDLDALADPATSGGLSDTGSYLRIRNQPWLEAPDDGLAFTFFPLSTDRLRVGYLYDLTFGGDELVQRGSLFRSPGIEARLTRGVGYYFAGFKMIPTSADDALTVEEDDPLPPMPGEPPEPRSRPIDLPKNQYGVLAGAGWDLFADSLRAELGGGLFQQGVINIVAEEGLTAWNDEQVFTTGGAARLVYHRNVNITPSIDLTLYRNDPNRPFRQFVPAEYVPEQLGWLLSVEGIYLASRLADVDTTGELTTEPAMAGALRARVHYDYLRVELTGVYRNLPFVLRHRPGLDLFSVPDAATAEPELFAALALDWHFPTPHLTVGASGGVRLPASIASNVRVPPLPTAPPDEGPFPAATAGRTAIVGPTDSFVLADGDQRDLVIAARLHARMDLSEMLWAILWVQYVRDPNTPVLVLPSVAQTPDRLGFGLSAAARF